MVPASAVVIVQARAGSMRLPGKVLLPFGESTLLGHILDRLQPAGLPLWVATSDQPGDDAVTAESGAHGASVFRGAEDDVLGRFAGCLDAAGPEHELVVRVCADRPFCCPVLLAELLDLYDAADGPDYLSNTITRSYPDGLDLELVRAKCLRAAAQEAPDPYEREHVTPFLYRRPKRFRLVEAFCPFGNFGSVRATIDTQHDYDMLVEVQRLLPADADYRDVLNLATLSPELFP